MTLEIKKLKDHTRLTLDSEHKQQSLCIDHMVLNSTDKPVHIDHMD